MIRILARLSARLMGLRPILCANDCFAKRTFLSIIKPTPDWKDGAARPPQAGRSESVVLESGFANKSGSKKTDILCLLFYNHVVNAVKVCLVVVFNRDGALVEAALHLNLCSQHVAEFLLDCDVVGVAGVFCHLWSLY